MAPLIRETTTVPTLAGMEVRGAATTVDTLPFHTHLGVVYFLIPDVRKIKTNQLVTPKPIPRRVGVGEENEELSFEEALDKTNGTHFRDVHPATQQYAELQIGQPPYFELNDLPQKYSI